MPVKIDIHSHRSIPDSQNELKIPNVIVSKDYLIRFPSTSGIHPWYIDEDFDKQFAALEHYQNTEGVIAVGECGLDKMISTPWDKQVYAFEKQVDLALKLNKPLIIHCVRAYSEVFSILQSKKTTVPVVFHGYAKNLELANLLLGHGYYISLGAQILKGGMLELIQNIPLDRLFLETDDKPIKIYEIYAYFCRSRKILQPDLEMQIMHNFKQVFNYNI